MDKERTYTESEIIDIINEGSNQGLVKVDCSKEQLLTILDDKESIEPVRSITNMLDIEHEVFFRLLVKRFDFNQLFRCSSMNGLTKNIIDLSKNAEIYGYEPDENGQNKLKGDLFEIFAELFFKLTSSDNRIGIRDYKPIIDSEDYGVDAQAVAINGMPATIQVKFRSNTTDLLTIKDIKNLQGLSYRKYKVPVESDTNIILFTNCGGVHWNTETNVMKMAILVYGMMGETSHYSLQKLVDNNTSFWQNLHNVVNKNINDIIAECK